MNLEDAIRLSRINQAKSASAGGYIIGNSRLNMSDDALFFESFCHSGFRKIGSWIGLGKMGAMSYTLRSFDDWEPLAPKHPLEALAEQAEVTDGSA